ncbi:hypothetical protein QW060_01505 [Myroides ceti]|uniref:Uncharacterized protein n=1 Tax=Paenimyroides ceti TaxID=395087 RepID=A0ABT8CMR0_9FLAO|nr:hypothetical protein [Paenimyroides ceti]MDN3705799.1 hypothetical protein [Paenimyroides ceti]
MKPIKKMHLYSEMHFLFLTKWFIASVLGDKVRWSSIIFKRQLLK